MRYPLRVVAVGGGTGLPMVLRGLKVLLFPDGADDLDRLVAVVTVTDDGGSSGRLRDELGMLPPGDIRNCLVALSHNEPLMSKLFQTRYRSEGSLSGHTLGNLMLAALAQEEGGCFLSAVRLASEVLNIQGRVFPSTLAPARLVADLEDGRRLVGETRISLASSRVRRLQLEPERPRATPGLRAAIEKADIVVLGPGSLYTSILPNLLIDEIAAALAETRAFRLLLVNAMTEPGETSAFSAADHVHAVFDHVGEGVLDGVLLADDTIPASTLARYEAEGTRPVEIDAERLERLVPLVDRRHMLQVSPKVRHEPLQTAGGVLASYARWCGAGRPQGVVRSAKREAN
ncbi:MAG: uridine diphosphate-N-acetylglucosamine-binding protein YvcK [Acidobacteriota bacterium]|nr:MAG: uridine diphosphate-N-acetylglucosamine-binding protein YvcK [Acidobacteriota bacterium]